MASNEPENSLYPQLLLVLVSLIAEASRYSSLCNTRHAPQLAELIGRQN
ncbi:hypothetical protein [Serratia grimesii]